MDIEPAEAVLRRPCPEEVRQQGGCFAKVGHVDRTVDIGLNFVPLSIHLWSLTRVPKACFSLFSLFFFFIGSFERQRVLDHVKEQEALAAARPSSDGTLTSSDGAEKTPDGAEKTPGGAEMTSDRAEGPANTPTVVGSTMSVPSEAALTPEEGRFPTSGWKALQDSRLISAFFTSSTKTAYFLDTTAADGEAACNFKAISSTDSKATRLWQRRFVKKVEVVAQDDIVYYRARCDPEMRSSAPYKIKLALKTKRTPECLEVLKVIFAECMPCPAGKAPRASCKHLAALMVGLEEFTLLGYTRDVVTCTDTLQKWNQPGKKKSEPCLAAELDWSRKGKSKRRKRTAAEYSDPRATEKRGKAADAVKEIVRSCVPEKCGLGMVAGDFLLKERNELEAVQAANDERRMLADIQGVPWKHPEVFDLDDEEGQDFTPREVSPDLS